MLSGRASDLLAVLRYRSHSGRLIQLHRALRRLDFEPASWLHPLLLSIGFGALAMAGADWLSRAWAGGIAWWFGQMGIPAAVTTEARGLLGLVEYRLVDLRVAAAPGSYPVWATTLTIVSVAALAAYLFGRRHLAMVYLVFANYFLVVVGLAWFAFLPAPFPHDITTHVRSGLEMSLMLVLLVPWLLAPSMYVFDLPLARKIAGTALIWIAIAVFAPLLYSSHALLMHFGSLVFLPLLYVLYGLLLNVLIFVSLYAWTLSWTPRR